MKYYLKQNHEEVKIGSRIKQSLSEKTAFGEYNFVKIITVTKDNLPILIKKGIIVEEVEHCLTFEEIFAKLAKKLSWDIDATEQIFKELDTVHKSFAFQFLLKEIAITLDKKYPNHIKECRNFYYISMLDGLIHNTTSIPVNFACVSLFRTPGDASEALKLLKPFHKALFPNLYEEESKN